MNFLLLPFVLMSLGRRSLHAFEYDPVVQYRFHRLMAWFWFALLVAVPFFYHPHAAGDWAALSILEASLYANFATDFGAMSSALAAMPPAPPPAAETAETEPLVFTG